MKKFFNKRKNFPVGFSLIELSIVILIIGLIIGGVIAGNKLISLSALSKARALTDSSPVNNTEDLVLWLETTSTKSFSTAKPTQNAAISIWNDINPQLTVKKNVVQATSGLQPHYEENAINGLPAVRFDGNTTEQYLRYAVNDQTLNPPHTIFLVLKQRVSGRSPVTKGNSRFNDSSRDWDIENTGSNLDYVTCVGGNAAVRISATSSRINSNYLMSFQWDGTTTTNSAIGYANGTIIENTATTPTPTANNYSLFVGGNGSYSFDGYIGELIIFNRSLSDFERRQIEIYLSKKWAIGV